MSGYSAFAAFYDALTDNVGYRERALYYDALIKKYGGKQGGILLDLACGTGSLSEEMARLGYDVIGTDSSPEMLSAATEKKLESGLPVQYLCQDMTELDMYGTVDVTVCALDSLNHLGSVGEIRRAAERVSLFCEPSGLFIFDVNTPKKHRVTLGNNTFVYETEEVFCVWQNEFDKDSPDNRVDISLDFFERDGDGKYFRSGEDFSEIAPEISVIREIAISSGFEIMAELDFDSRGQADESSDKILFICKKRIDFNWLR